MTKFYTNIHVYGNSILYRGYEDDLPVQKKIQYKPHLFVRGAGDIEYRLFKENTLLKKKEFDSISEMKEYVESMSDIDNFQVYGCKNLVRQFTAVEFSSDVMWDYLKTQIFFIDIETEVNGGFPDPDKADEPILLISMVNHHSKEIYLWTRKEFDLEQDILKPYAGKVNVRLFEEEKEMLRDFVSFFASTRIDVLSGWNSEFFDIPYTINRIKKVLSDSAANYLSPWKMISPRKVRTDLGDVKNTYDIIGITHLDYLDLYKKFNPGSKESFKLEYIAQLELGETKVDLPGESFKDSYENHWDIFVAYNIIDSVLLSKMESKLLQVQLAMQLAFIAKCQFADVMSSMRLWESIIYNYFLSLNIVEEWDKDRNEKENIVGAYVHDPVPGKYGWTVSIDATSLYPSIMMQNNISPETIVDYRPITIDSVLANNIGYDVPDDCIVSANGLITTKTTRGFIPILVERMFNLRKQTKNKMLDIKKEMEEIRGQESLATRLDALEQESRSLDVAQLAFKIAANAFYGVMGLVHFKYYDYRMAEAVTSTGQVFIKKTKEYTDLILEKVNGDASDIVMYLDTDSAYFSVKSIVAKHCAGKTDAEIVDFLEKFVFNVVQPSLNKKLLAFANNLGISDCKISFKLECIGPNIIFVAKKRYAFDILYSEGVRYKEPKTKVMGIEIVRSSTPSVVKDYLKECLKLCLSSTESALQSKVAEVRTKFYKQSYVDISFPRGVNGMSVYGDSVSIYRGATPIHVRGSLLYNHHIKRLKLESKYPLIAEGDKVKFIALKMPNTIHENVISYPGKLPAEFKLDKYFDYDAQFEKAFLKPLRGILDSIGWVPEEIVTLDMM